MSIHFSIPWTHRNIIKNWRSRQMKSYLGKGARLNLSSWKHLSFRRQRLMNRVRPGWPGLGWPSGWTEDGKGREIWLSWLLSCSGSNRGFPGPGSCVDVFLPSPSYWCRTPWNSRTGRREIFPEPFSLCFRERSGALSCFSSDCDLRVRKKHDQILLVFPAEFPAPLKPGLLLWRGGWWLGTLSPRSQELQAVRGFGCCIGLRR